MKNDTNGENLSQAYAAQSTNSAESLNHHDIRNDDDDQFEIPPPLIAWLARINQRYLSENMRENLLE
ncbi:MAG: hypothetical protein HOC09_03810 [Deltaproteobacteria bacterium]|jgi:hypothetical protein|nr:hypothetical protein [Deltaproteobacteria bacterium]